MQSLPVLGLLRHMTTDYNMMRPKSYSYHGLSLLNMEPSKLFAAAKQLETEEPEELERQIAEAPLEILHAGNNSKLFSFLIGFLERRGRFEEALRLLAKHPKIRTQSLIQASYLRVCRKLGRHEEIENFLQTNPMATKTEIFNVLYELVYFYEAQKDLQRTRELLERIERLFPTKVPILATLRNFFLRFGMFADASRVDARLAEIRTESTTPKFREAVKESGAEAYIDLEHQRQLAALSDLTNGISHELGQPITNIRYTIQLYSRQLEKDLKREVVFSVFETVLSETERMGGLIKRLEPIASIRRVHESFDAVSRVKERVDAERARLSNIQVEIEAKGPIFLQADPVRFDQLISNLLLNAIDALAERDAKHLGKIRIQMSLEPGKRLRILFEDNGPGILAAHRRKIFEPFFTTKSPGKGEGLGLFIVWNLLKMQGGSISLDSTYSNGARFVVVLQTEAKLPHITSES
jgi:C4-dicarboxylate-specific signal transduction histidine kinase